MKSIRPKIFLGPIMPQSSKRYHFISNDILWHTCPGFFKEFVVFQLKKCAIFYEQPLYFLKFVSHFNIKLNVTTHSNICLNSWTLLFFKLSQWILQLFILHLFINNIPDTFIIMHAANVKFNHVYWLICLVLLTG